MQNWMVKQLDTDLDCVDYKIKENQIIFEVASSRASAICPFCGQTSTKIHSVYQREIQDIPIQNKQTILLLNINKMFCLNPQCRHKTFAQRFNFIEPYGKKTKRLTEQILMTSVKLSSVTASALLKSHAVHVSKSSICDLLKKMPLIVDKSLFTKVCVDDFAFRKRYSYGSVMVDFETHRIIDILESRETKQVQEWLSSYPNLQVVSRDGARTYSSATSNSHPDALQVSDRFHLLKNLSEAVEKYMRRLFPSRLMIPATNEIQSEHMQALYDTRNRSERIRFARQKRTDGYTIMDIALLLHSSASTISKYLSLTEEEIPPVKENARELQHISQMEKKKLVIEEVRILYGLGHSVDEITRLTGHTLLTVNNYLKEDGSHSNGHYDNRRPGKLAPYEQTVIQMRAQGITYAKIHEHICTNGYSGTIASLRVFMQKERTHRRTISSKTFEPVEYIPRKYMIQLIYRDLKKIKHLTAEQYQAAIHKYPELDQLYTVLKEFHRIVFSRKSSELEQWMKVAASLQIEELGSYITGLKNDLQAVKNGVDYEYSNGLAEGSVNKIKLIKRIMYGRNSFNLLKAKILLNEYYYQIN